MAKLLPYFKWFPADAESDSNYAAMNLTEVGLYHRCLNHAWLNDGLPVDASEIARVLRISPRDFMKAWPRVSLRFQGTQRLRNSRQEEERVEAQTKSRKATDAINARHRMEGTAKAPQFSEPYAREDRASRMERARLIGKHTQIEWLDLLGACGGKCSKCGDSSREIQKDHIIPVYAGGSDSISNLQPLCSKCNAGKGPDQTDYRPEEVRLKYGRNTDVSPRAYGSVSESVSSEVFIKSEEARKEKISELIAGALKPEENPLTVEELETAWEMHHKPRGDQPRSLAFSHVVALGEKFDLDRFRKRHRVYCEYWDRRDWQFCPLSFLDWVQQAMPLPPPEPKTARKKSKNEELLEEIRKEIG